MSDRDEDVRLAIYRSYVETGRAPDRRALNLSVSLDEAAIDGSLARLHDARHIVLDDDGSIAMAHPFASIPLGFSVMGQDTLWWGGCAWDAFAIPHLVESDAEVLVATQCPGCGRPHAWVVNREAAPVGDQVAHFLVPTSRIWDDVIRTCGNQRIFCSVECVARWAETSGVEPGYVMDLGTLWRLAAQWYNGRLDRGYQRRDPEHARDYFREVGLNGPFWGLE